MNPHPNLGEFVGMGSTLDQTLVLMDSSVNHWCETAWAKRVGEEIKRATGAETPLEEAKAVWGWVKSRVRYRRDPEHAEWVQTPFTTLTQNEGDCDDMASAAGAILAAMGHSIRSVAVQWKGREWPSHAVVQDITAGVIVDPVTVAPEKWPPHPVERLIHS